MADQPLTDRQQAEIDSASTNALRNSPSTDVRQPQDVHAATLSTLSASPASRVSMCSVVPALDERGTPYILIARIAAHTRTLFKDQRASLFIRQGIAEGDPQAQWRATLMGTMTKLVVTDESSELEEYEKAITANDFEILKARYRERVPMADGYPTTHDFDFGEWTRSKRFATSQASEGYAGSMAPNFKVRPALMNRCRITVRHRAYEHDHQDALEIVCEALHGFEPINVKMVDLDRRGFFISRDGEPALLYTSFGRELLPTGYVKRWLR